jgi:hypothetical protein
MSCFSVFPLFLQNPFFSIYRLSLIFLLFVYLTSVFKFSMCLKMRLVVFDAPSLQGPMPYVYTYTYVIHTTRIRCIYTQYTLVWTQCGYGLSKEDRSNFCPRHYLCGDDGCSLRFSKLCLNRRVIGSVESEQFRFDVSLPRRKKDRVSLWLLADSRSYIFPNIPWTALDASSCWLQPAVAKLPIFLT